METSEQHAVATVREFFAALEESDFDTALALADPELVWINSSLPTVRGVRRIRRLLDLTAMSRVVIGATFHHIAPAGDVVLTERTDTVKLGRVRVRFWVCGTFEFVDSRISVWRDYFSWGNVLRGAIVGVVRALLSGGRS